MRFARLVDSGCRGSEVGPRLATPFSGGLSQRGFHEPLALQALQGGTVDCVGQISVSVNRNASRRSRSRSRRTGRGASNGKRKLR